VGDEYEAHKELNFASRDLVSATRALPFPGRQNKQGDLFQANLQGLNFRQHAYSWSCLTTTKFVFWLGVSLPHFSLIFFIPLIQRILLSNFNPESSHPPSSFFPPHS
jgi:hypothetical protein